MKIQYYSRLFKAETEEQYRARTILRFQKIVDKRRAKGEHVVFDVDIVQNDMDRWFTQKAKENRDIKPQLEAYKTHEELHAAMRNFKSKAEIENDLKTGDFEHEGKELVLSFGVYKVFKTRDVKALTLLAQNSNWCVRYPNGAKKYLIELQSTFYIVLRGTDRFVAIRETEENKPNVEVWWYTDYELRNGQTHATFSADLIQEDLDAINNILQKLGFTKLIPGELFEVYPNIEEYLRYSRENKEYQRFLYNQRFYPELANQLFPPGMQIEGTLDLSGCTELTKLPEGLSVGGTLDLNGCTGLTSLPEGLSVGGTLNLSGCTGLTSLPEGLSVGGTLDLRGCTGLTSLPEGLSVGGTLFLINCTGLTKLPEGLSVGKSLDLEGCTGLTSLPEGLSVGGTLDLNGCTGLTSLPEGLSVEGTLDLDNCTGLTSLPEGLSVGGHLFLNDCTGLTSLPEGLSVGGYLNLSGCTGLTSLPEGLSVGGTLDLRGCTGLTSLPEGLSVGGTLFLINCTGLTSLPKGLYVYGNLHLAYSGKSGSIEKLPNDLTVMETIYGRNPITGVPYQEEYEAIKGRNVG